MSGTYWSEGAETDVYEFIFDIGSLPDEGGVLVVTPMLDEGLPSGMEVSPSSFSFISNSTSTTGSFIFLGDDTTFGSYTVTLDLSGSVKYVAPGGNTVTTFKKSSEPPDPPALKMRRYCQSQIHNRRAAESLGGRTARGARNSAAGGAYCTTGAYCTADGAYCTGADGMPTV